MLVALLCVLQVADFVTTRLALHRGAVESNPLVQFMGLWEAKLLALVIVVVVVATAKRALPIVLLTGLYIGVVISNLRLLFLSN